MAISCRCPSERLEAVSTFIFGVKMNPQSAPVVPGDTPGARLSNALRMVLSVTKEDLLKKETRLKRAGAKKRAKKL